MNRLKTLFLATALALSGTLPARAADWAVETAQSTLGFSGTQSGAAFQGHFARWQGTISFDPAHPESGHAHIVIDMTSASTGDGQKDESLPSSDWFDAKSFPQAIFEANGFRAKGGNNFEADGTLSIRGVKKSVTLPFTLDIANGMAHAKGTLPIVRTDFGVGQGAWASGQMVALAVTVTFDLLAKAQP